MKQALFKLRPAALLVAAAMAGIGAAHAAPAAPQVVAGQASFKAKTDIDTAYLCTYE